MEDRTLTRDIDLEVRAVNEDARIFEGVANSASQDGHGTVIEPAGAVFKLPLPIHLRHDKALPVGNVIATWLKDGLRWVRGQIPKIDDDGTEGTRDVKRRVDAAWAEVKSGLVRGLSVEFLPIDPPSFNATRWKKWEWRGLGLLTNPSNTDARIAMVRSAPSPATAGTPSPDASGTVRLSGTRGGAMFANRIRELRAEKTTKEAQMQSVAQRAAGEGRTMDTGEQEAFDTHLSDMEAIQSDIDRFERAAAMAERAQPVDTIKSTDGAARTRGASEPMTRVHVTNLPKGTGFTRYAMALAASRGSISDALRWAERWRSSTPEVIDLLERANAQTSTDSTSSGPLVYAQNLVSEFIDLLRPATVLGRIPGVRNVPFKVRIPRMTAGFGAFNWVGEGAAKPVGEEDFDTVTLDHHKAAGIIVLTDELVKLSAPNAEELARRDMVEQMARFLDVQFLRITVASGANNPASITNGITPVAATGDDADALEADLFSAFATFDDNDSSDDSVVLLMQPKTARSIALMRPDIGNGRLYPELSPRGGSLLGYPVLVSNSVDNGFIVIVKGSEVLMADDGSVALDASREATIDMAGGNSPAFSLWQKNAVGIRAERGITWKRRRDEGSVAIISGAYYGTAAVVDS